MKQIIKCPECGYPIIGQFDVLKNVPSEIAESIYFNCHNCNAYGFDQASEFEILPAISVKQPWAYSICKGLKPIENRTWKLPEKYKGKTVLIHVSKAAEFDCCKSSPFAPLFPIGAIINSTLEKEQKQDIIKHSRIRSAIIGAVDIVDCVLNHESIWAEHVTAKEVKKNGIKYTTEVPVYNWVLENPILFEKPIENIRGQLSFFIPKID